MATVEELLDRGEKKILKSKNVDLWRPSDARVNAEELLGKVLGKEITGEEFEDVVPPGKVAQFDKLVARRAGGEPVALIIGFTEFRKLKMATRKGIFVPRNSSELMAEMAAAKVKRRAGAVVVDVACGCGPVALAVAHEAPRARVVGLDIYKPALKLGRRNAGALGLKVEFIHSDMLAKLPEELRGKVNVFTIHPPYVAKAEMKNLPREITDYEPVVSLTDHSDDGLGLTRQLAVEAPQWLRKGGWVMVEVSPDLSRRVGGILRRAGFRDVKSNRDSLGATRVVAGRL